MFKRAFIILYKTKIYSVLKRILILIISERGFSKLKEFIRSRFIKNIMNIWRKING